jgi:nuclear-control-of-ATPase protein 2
MKFLSYVLKTPINIASNDIHHKIALIHDEITNNTDKIDTLIKLNYSDQGQILTTLEAMFSINTPSHSRNNRIYQVILEVIYNKKSVNFSATEIPSILTRYWPIILIVLKYGPSGSLNIYNNREEIIHWIKYNLVDTSYGFFKNWLIKPLNDMLSILRHDDSFTITSKESLQSDLDSLERMVVEFLADENVTGFSREQIHNCIQNGDLTLLMNEYESQIRTPYLSLIKGGLVRSLLIQIQKTKVDGGIALTGIDKMLKSQQLLFGFVSLSPSVFILWKSIQYLTTSKPLIINGKQVNVHCLKGLNSIENLLILLNENDEPSEKYEGMLLIEIVNLIIISKLIIPKQLQKDWVRDLNELNNSSYNFDTKLHLIRKIWSMYGSYFR